MCCYACCQGAWAGCHFATQALCCNGCGSCAVAPFSRDPVVTKEYKWLPRHKRSNCPKCDDVKDSRKYKCKCRRNRHLAEAFAYLFNCSTMYIKSMLFKIAIDERELEKSRTARNEEWQALLNVTAPLSDFFDFDIYDNMYDRCGRPIDPLQRDNTLKVMRLIFFMQRLTDEQQQSLRNMLDKLNDHAKIRVNVRKLLKAVQQLTITELICSVMETDRKARNLYNAKRCRSLCNIYYDIAEPLQEKAQPKAKAKSPKRPKWPKWHWNAKKQKRAINTPDLRVFCPQPKA